MFTIRNIYFLAYNFFVLLLFKLSFEIFFVYIVLIGTHKWLLIKILEKKVSDKPILLLLFFFWKRGVVGKCLVIYDRVYLMIVYYS
jgi:hypothetical protein